MSAAKSDASFDDSLAHAGRQSRRKGNKHGLTSPPGGHRSGHTRRDVRMSVESVVENAASSGRR